MDEGRNWTNVGHGPWMEEGGGRRNEFTHIHLFNFKIMTGNGIKLIFQ